MIEDDEEWGAGSITMANNAVEGGVLLDVGAKTSLDETRLATDDVDEDF